MKISKYLVMASIAAPLALILGLVTPNTAQAIPFDDDPINTVIVRTSGGQYGIVGPDGQPIWDPTGNPLPDSWEKGEIKTMYGSGGEIDPDNQTTKRKPSIGGGKVGSAVKNAFAFGLSITALGIWRDILDNYCYEVFRGAEPMSSEGGQGLMTPICDGAVAVGVISDNSLQFNADGVPQQYLYVPPGAEIGQNTSCKYFIGSTSNQNASNATLAGSRCLQISAIESATTYNFSNFSITNSGRTINFTISVSGSNPSWNITSGLVNFRCNGGQYAASGNGTVPTVTGPGNYNVTLTCPTGQGSVIGPNFFVRNGIGVYHQFGLWTVGYEPAPEGTVPGTMIYNLTCSDGATTTVITENVTMNIQPGQPVLTPEISCPSGSTSIGVEVDWVPDEGSPIEVIPPSSDQIIPGIDEFIELYPECFNGEMECLLELSEKRGTKTYTCGSVGQLCPDWASDPYAPTSYECTYGGHLIDLNYCSTFRAPWIGVLPNVDEEGTVIPYTAPPDFGLTEPVPGVDTQVSRQGCAPPSFWDAVTNIPYWIWQGTLCALSDAFVPNQTKLITNFQELNQSWMGTPPGKIINWVEDLWNDVPVLEGCEGPRINFEIDWTEFMPGFVVNYDDYPLSACEPPFDWLATMARMIGAGAMMTFSVISISRYIGGVIGFPGFGKD